MAHEQREQGKLARGKGEGPAVLAHTARVALEHERPARQAAAAVRSRMTARGVQAVATDERAGLGDEQRQAERLRHVVVRAASQANELVVLLVVPGDDDDGRRVAAGAQALEHSEAVGVGKVQFKQHEVKRTPALGGRQSLRSRGAARGVHALVPQEHGKRLQDLLVVIYDEHALTCHLRLLRPSGLAPAPRRAGEPTGLMLPSPGARRARNAHAPG